MQHEHINGWGKGGGGGILQEVAEQKKSRKNVHRAIFFHPEKEFPNEGAVFVKALNGEMDENPREWYEMEKFST